jgi:hypothetical protein
VTDFCRALRFHNIKAAVTNFSRVALGRLAIEGRYHSCSQHAVTSRNGESCLMERRNPMPRREPTDEEEAVIGVLKANLEKPLTAPEIAKQLGWDDWTRVEKVIDGMELLYNRDKDDEAVLDALINQFGLSDKL